MSLMRFHQPMFDFILYSQRTRDFDEIPPVGGQFRFVFLENEMFLK